MVIQTQTILVVVAAVQVVQVILVLPLLTVVLVEVVLLIIIELDRTKNMQVVEEEDLSVLVQDPLVLVDLGVVVMDLVQVLLRQEQFPLEAVVVGEVSLMDNLVVLVLLLLDMSFNLLEPQKQQVVM